MGVQASLIQPAEMLNYLQKLHRGLTPNLPCRPCNALQEHFKQRKPAKTAEQLARQRQQLLASVPEEQRAQIDEKMLGAATGVLLVQEHICNGTLFTKPHRGAIGLC